MDDKYLTELIKSGVLSGPWTITNEFLGDLVGKPLYSFRYVDRDDRGTINSVLNKYKALLIDDWEGDCLFASEDREVVFQIRCRIESLPQNYAKLSRSVLEKNEKII